MGQTNAVIGEYDKFMPEKCTRFVCFTGCVHSVI